MGKYEKNKIYVMDCIKGMEQFLDDGEVDVIVTSYANPQRSPHKGNLHLR